MGRGATVQRARVSLWRDAAPPPAALADNLARAEPVEALPVETKAIESQPIQPTVTSVQVRDAFRPTTPLLERVKPVEAEPVNPTLAEPVEADATETRSSVEPLLRFSVQARLIGAWIVLVPDQALQDAASQRLWDNMTEAMQASAPHSFLWPLAEGTRWQRMEGVSAAFAGFLYRLGKTQRVGLMGELPDQVCPDRIEQLPSLPELLANPLQKRSLWLLLRS